LLISLTALVETQRLQAAADRLDDWLDSGELIVAPYHLQIEFSATLRSLERRRLMTQEEADATFHTLESLPIEYNWDDAWVRRAIQIARSIGASRTYDSLYLACAESHGARLYTCDAAFARACGHVSSAIVMVD
jgi:predicted nucleic acid-binding protein